MISTSILLLASILPPAAEDHSGFGRSICFCGDLDGDKCSEIAVGSRSAGDKRQGSVLVYSGKTGKLLRTITSDIQDSGFGTEVCAAGDQDGDGIADIAVAAPLTRRVKDSGTVEIRSGKDGHVVASLIGTDEELYFGTNVVAIGDLDGDKKDELLVGMRVGRGPKEHERFAVVSPGSGQRLHVIDAPVGSLSRENGVPVAALGDVDGDGTPAFAVEYGAQVFVHSGKDGKLLLTLGVPLEAGAKSTFGTSICGPGDIDGDHRPDIAIGQPGESGRGCVRFFSGRDGKEVGTGSGEKLAAGLSLDCAGDVNADGCPDVVASRCDRFLGVVFILSSRDGSEIRSTNLGCTMPGPGELPPPLGWRVAAGTDIDGDGTADFMASCWWPTLTKGSAVLVLSGKDGKRIHEIHPPSRESGKTLR